VATLFSLNGTHLNSSPRVDLFLPSLFLNQTDIFVLDLNLPIFFGLYLGYKYFNKTKFWKASEMDFYTVSDFSLSGFTSLTTLAS